ncbi:tRNA 2-selenouridine(34) synthase MnmH [Leptolyngbya sp. FACHB-36]|uniref:tRNA 2-selenouridine(34) synthase MnmH n=1 Tax=Leptolyngbya sp. FACHB-36 TaxID=2692808 RepID=UPI001681854B|nr:tRNA 2-selenouridine(34) synthase MnmH [Leptolyngbya sp. FACHB-36]MBD2022524.1 tRNA 2-selenouridine(34) synthase MnmH [Leptolyngbya sp. FACHB-36]
MPDVLATPKFLAAPGVLLDVRSPAEYAQGHLPAAVSFPLFSNDERSQVGTCYKQEGHDRAVELGLAIAGPKLAQFVVDAKALAPDRTLRIHCWRGGMRSGSMAWLMETAGFRVSLLDHGYKGFRQWVRSALAVPKPILTLGGMTGTGKTSILHALAAQGEQVLDLEQLANHRGSSYGNLGLPPQPTTEQFENLIVEQWAALEVDRPVWIEAESRMVGCCRVPDELFLQMVAAPVLQIERSRSERVALLIDVYGSVDREHLITATERLRKRLGGDRTQQAIQWIQQGNLATAIEVVLNYYDKTYLYDLQRRQVPIYSVSAAGLSDSETAQQLIQTAHQVVVETGFQQTEKAAIVAYG